jgi:hypothetical protein
MLKLPREIENDPRQSALVQVLENDKRLLWTGGTLPVAQVGFSSAFELSLVDALRGRAVERGLENIDQVLDREAKGLLAGREKQKTPVPNRISRLLIVANDGSERFYRQFEATLKRHADRVLALRVDVPSSRFSEKLFGADKLVKVLLVSDREAVAKVLLSLAGS